MTHYVTQIRVNIGIGKGLLPHWVQTTLKSSQHQAITWINVDLSLMRTGPLAFTSDQFCKKCPSYYFINMIYKEFENHNFKSIATSLGGQLVNWSPPSAAYALMNWVSIGWDNCLSPWRRQAIFWTNADVLSIGLLGTYFSEIWIRIL